MSTKILRLKDVKTKCGLSKSCIYNLIEDGLFPRGFKISKRAVGWSEPQVDRILHARSVGRTDDEIKGIVSEINNQASEI